MTRKVGAPLAVLIIAGVLAGVLLLFAGAINPGMFFAGLLPTLLFFAGAIVAYLWLDRWEPEPLRLLVFAFLWGAGVATVGALLIGLLFEVLGVQSYFMTAVVQAPIVEEALKGALLVVMLTGRRRSELNSLTDFLVYAGFVGLGFAFVEDLLYISNSATLQQAIFTGALRLVMGVFAHPFFTSATAIGLYYATRVRSKPLKAVIGIGGYLGAVALHATWNGSASMGLGVYFGVYLLILVPLFAGLVVVAVRSRSREGRTVREQLPRMVAEQLVLPEEAVWLDSLATRGARFKAVRRVAGPQAAKQVRHFTDVVTELAFVRDRIDRGHGTSETAYRHAGLVEAVRVERIDALPHMIAAWHVEGAPGTPAAFPTVPASGPAQGWAPGSTQWPSAQSQPPTPLWAAPQSQPLAAAWPVAAPPAQAPSWGPPVAAPPAQPPASWAPVPQSPPQWAPQPLAAQHQWAPPSAQPDYLPQRGEQATRPPHGRGEDAPQVPPQLSPWARPPADPHDRP